MKLTTKGRYAVTTLLDMALRDQTSPITISEVAKRHHLSPTYLERLAGKLRQQGLLKSVRGAQGGYLLGKKPEEITVAEIIKAVEEKLDSTRCQGQANCHEGNVCLTHHLWASLNHVIFEFLQKITLKDLAQRPNDLNQMIDQPASKRIFVTSKA